MTFTPGATIRSEAAAQVFVDDLDHVVLEKADLHHLMTVRRLRAGEAVIAADGTGSWRRCAVDDNRNVVADGEIEFEPEPAQSLTVAFAPVKGDRSEWAVAKLTELGADRIVALATERGAVRWGSAAAGRALERWERVAKEACCQARRVRLPVIAGPSDVASFLNEHGVGIAVPGGPALGAGTSTLLIGPEGGWSEAELALRFEPVGLAGNVLRTETAAISAGVLLEAIRAGTVALVENNDSNVSSGTATSEDQR